MSGPLILPAQVSNVATQSFVNTIILNANICNRIMFNRIIFSQNPHFATTVNAIIICNCLGNELLFDSLWNATPPQVANTIIFLHSHKMETKKIFPPVMIYFLISQLRQNFFESEYF